jgi:hypothetical protein
MLELLVQSRVPACTGLNRLVLEKRESRNMFEEIEASIRELQWLAQYYERHGMKKEAKEIRDTLSAQQTRYLRSGEVIPMYTEEEKKA